MKGEIKMINAKEAYDLSAPNLDTYRAFIDKRIREAASNNEGSKFVDVALVINWEK